ncbi:hypothetical protein ATK36_5544 [Amycolatopsis sulphurea]|uniref:Uncharacterized protein n=1 Tax=Amycolatopsis sulphurea TaxID=76022 RepID=A0A2A9FIC6_9PSEU|nr:hypothetical protein ATK36_5544 [Amycolatopsis sulphurea]
MAVKGIFTDSASRGPAKLVGDPAAGDAEVCATTSWRAPDRFRVREGALHGLRVREGTLHRPPQLRRALHADFADTLDAESVKMPFTAFRPLYTGRAAQFRLIPEDYTDWR